MSLFWDNRRGYSKYSMMNLCCTACNVSRWHLTWYWMGYKPGLNFLTQVPCTRKGGKEIIFLLNPLIKLKNTKYALVGEVIEIVFAALITSASLPKVKTCPCYPWLDYSSPKSLLWMLISISAVNLTDRLKGREVTGQGGLNAKNVSYLFQNVKD